MPYMECNHRSMDGGVGWGFRPTDLQNNIYTTTSHKGANHLTKRWSLCIKPSKTHFYAVQSRTSETTSMRSLRWYRNKEGGFCAGKVVF